MKWFHIPANDYCKSFYDDEKNFAVVNDRFEKYHQCFFLICMIYCKIVNGVEIYLILICHRLRCVLITPEVIKEVGGQLNVT